MNILDDILGRYTAHTEDTRGLLLGAAFVVRNKDGAMQHTTGWTYFVNVCNLGILYSGAAGRSDFENDSPAFSTRTLTWIASMTKLITTTCVMQLVERGLINLDDDVRNRVPELYGAQILRGFTDQKRPILEDNTETVTLRLVYI
ncbi:hypothetical protein NLG97_g4083 [Lecanicillium saksenae]|uniref:Uncharacterized protein n=1 Tax=Lecanicillium saksenae TaxID=468837 RepID=A0ACC1R079_9HYPO|nr:hypothetical protein NLG97_g4083 [Lecanicillium saksenae]